MSFVRGIYRYWWIHITSDQQCGKHFHVTWSTEDSVGFSISSPLSSQRIYDAVLCFFSPWWNIFRVTGHCAGNSSVPGEFPAQRPVTRSFDVFFDLRLNKWLSKQPWGWWFETLSCPLWRHSNVSGVRLNKLLNKKWGCWWLETPMTLMRRHCNRKFQFYPQLWCCWRNYTSCRRWWNTKDYLLTIS